ncbi:DNA (cytosine-5-)-methyltransferase [Ligilactobacillus hayakitensis]|nr:DNA (cytosine-5-)-methyltransferase [Ligilactobacillus hayakitensis]
MSKLNVFSMFDGVGGFIIGLNNADNTYYTTKYSNQYEPSRKAQDAFEVGKYRFPDMEHIGVDVATIPDAKFEEMKDNGVNMIVGGFPCQDYSVAHTGAKGIQGKKGVLFWEIIRATENIRPKYLILENVDRLLKSPSSQRGRDFAIMLKAFNDLGYSLEWRVINAAEYGEAQRRRRVFFYVYRNDTPWGKKTQEMLQDNGEVESLEDLASNPYEDYIFKKGLFARQFPIKQEPVKNRVAEYTLDDDIVEISDNFTGKVFNTGIMHNGHYYTIETAPTGDEKPRTLGEIIQPVEDVDEKYYFDESDPKDKAKLEKFAYLRGPKKIKRKSADGHEYTYSEGGMSAYDSLDLPSRTMLTSEGTTNRSTHFLKVGERYRLLTPIEAERLQDFPDDWTKYKLNEKGEVVEVSDRMRMFFMGNALVTGIVKRIGIELKKLDSM